MKIGELSNIVYGPQSELSNDHFFLLSGVLSDDVHH